MEKSISRNNKMFGIKSISSVSSMTKIAMLSVIAYVIMFIEFPLPLFPPFLKLDFSDLPALIGAFAMGPMAGIIIEALKNILHFITKTTTGGVGEFANFLVGSALIIPAGILYIKSKTKKTAVYGVILGIILMSVVGAIANYYILLPFYAKMMPIDQIIAWSAAANGAITDVKTLILYAVIPFNLLKGVIVSVPDFDEKNKRRANKYYSGLFIYTVGTHVFLF